MAGMMGLDYGQFVENQLSKDPRFLVDQGEAGPAFTLYGDPNYGFNAAAAAGVPMDGQGKAPYLKWLADKYIKDQGYSNWQDWFTKDPANQQARDFGAHINPATGQIDMMNYDGSEWQNGWSGPLTLAAMALTAGAASGALGAGTGAAEGAAGTGGSIFAEGASPGAFGWGGGEVLGGSGALAGGAGVADASWGVNPATTGGSMDLGDWQDFSSFLGDSGSNFVGDIPTVGDVGGTSIYGANPSISDLYSQYQLSGQSPADFLKQITGMPNTPSGVSDIIKKFLGGDSSASTLSTIGKLLGAGLSYLGGQKQSGALQSLAQQNLAFGAPSRARFEASMTPGFDPMSIPGYSGALDTASKSILAKLAATGGNPFGNPGGLIDANKQIVSGTALPAIQNYQNTNLNAGYGPGFGASNTAAMGAINADAGSLTGAAGALGQLTAPDNSITGLLAQLKAAGVNLNGNGGLSLNNGLGF